MLVGAACQDKKAMMQSGGGEPQPCRRGVLSTRKFFVPYRAARKFFVPYRGSDGGEECREIFGYKDK